MSEIPVRRDLKELARIMTSLPYAKRLKIAMRLAYLVASKFPDWSEWAKKWESGEDRTPESANHIFALVDEISIHFPNDQHMLRVMRALLLVTDMVAFDEGKTYNDMADSEWLLRAVHSCISSKYDQAFDVIAGVVDEVSAETGTDDSRDTCATDDRDAEIAQKEGGGMKRIVEIEVENCRTLNLDVLCPHLIESEAFCYCACNKQGNRTSYFATHPKATATEKTMDDAMRKLFRTCPLPKAEKEGE